MAIKASNIIIGDNIVPVQEQDLVQSRPKLLDNKENGVPSDGTPFTKKKSQYMSDMLNPDL